MVTNSNFFSTKSMKKLLCNVNSQSVSCQKSLILGPNLWMVSQELNCLCMIFPFFLDPENSCSWLQSKSLLDAFGWLSCFVFVLKEFQEIQAEECSSKENSKVNFSGHPFILGNKGKKVFLLVCSKGCIQCIAISPKSGDSTRETWGRLRLSNRH